MLNSELLKITHQRFCLLTLLILLLFTHVLFTFIDHFEPVTDNLLLNSSFEQGSEHWKVSGKRGLSFDQAAGRVQLHNPTQETSVVIRQYIDRSSSIRYFRVNVVLSTFEVKEGKKPWQVARIVLAGVDQDNRVLWGIPHLVVGKQGSHRKQAYAQVFEMPDLVTRLMILAQLPYAKGNMIIDEILVFGVQKKSGVEGVKWGLMLLWILLLFWIVVLLYRKVERKKSLLIVLTCAGAIGIGALISGEMKSFLTLSSLYALGLDSLGLHVSAIGHFVMFLLLSLLALFLFRNVSSMMLLGAMFVFAMVTETLQFFAVTRTPSVEDLIVDMSGVFLGFVVCRVVFLIKGKGIRERMQQ